MNENSTETTRRHISVIILTYNEEANLPACLESLKGLDSEVFVVDSGSTDRTAEIARATGAQVLEHQFENYAAQRNWAQQNLPIKSEWLLHLDADERLTPELVNEIRETLGVKGEAESVKGKEQGAGSSPRGVPAFTPQGKGQRAERGPKKANEIDETNETNQINETNPEPVDGYLLRKRTVFMGRWIKHGGHYPSYHLRLFRKDRGSCEDRLYDQHFLVNGKVARLKNDYIDVLTSDIDTWTQRHVHWAGLEAREVLADREDKHRVRPSLLGNPIERRRWLREGLYARSPLFLRVFLYWFYRYFIRLGFLDGKEGLIFHFLQGFWFRFLVDAKLFERQRNSNHH